MDWNLDYGDLAKEEAFVNTCEELKENLKDLQKVLDQLLPLKEKYDEMPLSSQIELDLFFAYTLNGLHWVHLRLQGEDPTKHPIKEELQRIRAAMQRWQEIQDLDKRPKMDIEAAKRFIRSGLYDPYKGSARPQNKRMRFEDNDE